VVWPESADDVARIVAYARETQTPIVPYGAGSGVCGAVQPSKHTIVVDLKRLSHFVLRPEQSLVEVGSGMLGITFEEELQARGYTVGHFPSSILCSTVGGWLAARGAGQCSGLYGKIEDMVVGADVVLGTGRHVSMDWRSGGPNLTPLIVGSEGTLGVITKARLRLHKVAQERVFSAYEFRSVQAGWEALRGIYQKGLRPAVARLYDPLDTALNSNKSGGDKSARSLWVMKNALRIPRAINGAVRALEGHLLTQCRLILIFEGAAHEATEDSMRATRICSHLGGVDLGEGPARAWLEHRYSVSYRQSPIFRMGAFSDTMEVAAPWSKLPAVYDGVRRALGQHVVVLSHLSHAYPDGCSIYFTFSAAKDSDAEALATYDALWPEALAAALEAGATLSHHHGVGRSKAPSLGKELGYGVELLWRLKQAWDPVGIFNPGALLPEHRERSTAPSIPTESCIVDEVSLLADLNADLTLDESANLLSRRGYTLGVGEPLSLTLREWLARGMPGLRSRWEDPVDQALVGLVALTGQGEQLQLMPAPRRAVGPDLTTLFVGERRVGAVQRVTLRVHPVGGQASRSLPGRVASRTAMGEAERTAWELAVLAMTDKR
jgi:alkyldihydroxyacetonephosphate synthase